MAERFKAPVLKTNKYSSERTTYIGGVRERKRMEARRKELVSVNLMSMTKGLENFHLKKYEDTKGAINEGTPQPDIIEMKIRFCAQAMGIHIVYQQQLQSTNAV